MASLCWRAAICLLREGTAQSAELSIPPSSVPPLCAHPYRHRPVEKPATSLGGSSSRQLTPC